MQEIDKGLQYELSIVHFVKIIRICKKRNVVSLQNYP